MKIYQHEIDDGIAENIESNDSIAFECDIINSDISQLFPSVACLLQTDTQQIKQSFAFLGIEDQQDDLYYLNSILVSAGWNKNDDVFGVENLWAARQTPINKQFNYNHDDTDIIGHITNAMVLDQNGKVIENQSAVENLPESIDIITSAVIYKTWSDKYMRERIEELTQEIDQGKWSVSMECVFNDFDYAIIGPDNDNRVLARSEESSFLTKHLRAYGGTGEYQGYKVGRLLKGFYFSGKGLVAKPANPRSIIFSKGINPFNTKANIDFNNFLTATEIHDMSQETKQMEDLQAELEASKAEFEAEKSEIVKSNEEKLAELTEANDTAIAEKDQVIASLEAKVKELEDAVALMHDDKKKKEEEMKKMQEENKGMKYKMKGMKRKAQLTEAGADEDTAEKLLAEFQEASDEMFESVVALIQDRDASSKPAPAPAPAPEPVFEPAAEADDEDEEDEEADASVLEEVEEVAEATLANPESEEDQNVAVASAANWLRESVLKSTKNLSK
jgi:hypothetical protein